MTGQFVAIKKDFLLDPGLTATAVRVGTYLADRARMPGGWTIHYRDVMKTLGLGKNAVYAAFNCLEAAGYMSKGPVVNGNQATPPVIHHDKILHRSPKQGMADTGQGACEPFPESRNGSAGTANPERESGKTNHDQGVKTDDSIPSNQERLATRPDDLGSDSCEGEGSAEANPPQGGRVPGSKTSTRRVVHRSADVDQTEVEDRPAISREQQQFDTARQREEVSRLLDELSALTGKHVGKIRSEMREAGSPGGFRAQAKLLSGWVELAKGRAA